MLMNRVTVRNPNHSPFRSGLLFHGLVEKGNGIEFEGIASIQSPIHNRFGLELVLVFPCGRILSMPFRLHVPFHVRVRVHGLRVRREVRIVELTCVM